MQAIPFPISLTDLQEALPFTPQRLPLSVCLKDAPRDETFTVIFRQGDVEPGLSLYADNSVLDANHLTPREMIICCQQAGIPLPVNILRPAAVPLLIQSARTTCSIPPYEWRTIVPPANSTICTNLPGFPYIFLAIMELS